MDIQRDGIDFINVYSRGQTKLGTFLSNFTRHPVDLSDIGLGKFSSIEGLWYYLRLYDDSLEPNNQYGRLNDLRHVHGNRAKDLGRNLRASVRVRGGKQLSEEDFRIIITTAVTRKIVSSKYLDEFINSELPFVHRYVYNGVMTDAGCEWLMEHLTKIRTMWREGNYVT